MPWTQQGKLHPPPCTISSTLLGGPTPGHRCQRRAISQHRWGLWNKNAFWQSNKNLESTSQKKIENPLKSGAGDFYKFLGMAGPLAIKLRSKWKWKASLSRCNLYLKKSRQKKTIKNAIYFPLIYAPSRFFSLFRTSFFLVCFPTTSRGPTGNPAPGTVRSSMSWSGDSGWKREDTVDGVPRNPAKLNQGEVGSWNPIIYKFYKVLYMQPVVGLGISEASTVWHDWLVERWVGFGIIIGAGSELIVLTWFGFKIDVDMDVSKNRGKTPKWMVK